MRRILASFTLATSILLAGCQQTAVPPSPERITFTRYEPIYFDVSSIEVIDEFKPPLRPPHVEELMPYSPTEAMHIWVRDRMRAAGGDKTIQVIIKDASVVETDLPKPEGISGFFTVSQDKRYNARLSVEMRLYSGGAMSAASIAATATRSVTTSENDSIDTRQAVFRRMVYDLMESMNAELEKNIYLYFGNDIVYSHTP